MTTRPVRNLWRTLLETFSDFLHILLTTVAIVVCLVANVRADEAEQVAERKIDKMIADLGGTVRHDENQIWRPTIYVGLSNTKVADAALAELRALKQLRSLNLHGTGIGDAGLNHLAGQTSLQELFLGGTKITDKGLSTIGGLKALRTLNLSKTAIGDEGLKQLAALKDLRILNLASTKATDAGLKELSNLEQLEELYLNNTAVADMGVKSISKLTKLQILSLAQTRVTGTTFDELKSLKQLQSLTLSGTPISDEQLMRLAEVKQLRRLEIINCKQITIAGVGDLAKALPDCRIVHDGE